MQTDPEGGGRFLARSGDRHGFVRAEQDCGVMSVLVTGSSLALLLVWLCRLFRSEWDRTRLLVLVTVVAGLLLLNLPALRVLVDAGGRPVVEVTRQTGYVLGPFVLLAGAMWGLWRLARWVWAHWPERSAAGRSLGLLGSVAVGLVAAVLLRSVPLVAEVTQVAELATTAGVRAGWDAAVERIGLVLGIGP
jgi:hypothetical protein